MTKRYIEDTVLYDGDLSRLSDATFRIFILMLAKADDFGILPCDPAELCKILSLPESHREILKLSVIELASTIGRFFEHHGKLFFAFKPDSFDRIQHQLIRWRTRSAYLKVNKEQAFEIRASAFDSQGSKYRIQYFTVNYASMDTTATTNTLSSLSSPEKKSNTSRRRARELPPPAAEPPPLRSDRASSIPEEVVCIMHRLGAATGLDAYRHISLQSWVPAIHQHARHLGYRCLYLEAVKFEQWFTGEFEASRIKSSVKPNPRSRFFNHWLSRVKPEFHTAPDTETNFPDDHHSSPYESLVSTPEN